MAADLPAVSRFAERIPPDAAIRPRRVLVAVAVLLFSAAALKAYGLWRGGIPSAVPFSSPHWQLAFIELEAALGLWFISGRGERAAWCAAAFAFAVFTGVSALLALNGYRTCACFGPIRVNPWVTCAIDAAALAALWRVRPSGSLGWTASRGAVFALGGAIGIALIALYLLAGNDALLTAISRLRGDSLIVEPGVSYLGEGRPGEWRAVSVRVHNHSNGPRRIVGCLVGCAVAPGTELPVAVEAGSAVDIVLSYQIHGQPGDFAATPTLFTDDERQFELPVNVVGTIVPPPEP